MSTFFSSLGLTVEETKKVPFTNEDLVVGRESLRTVEQDSRYHPLDSDSWRYIRSWVHDNPRSFDGPRLRKFKDVIMDDEFPPVRQRFVTPDLDEDCEDVDCFSRIREIFSNLSVAEAHIIGAFGVFTLLGV